MLVKKYYVDESPQENGDHEVHSNYPSCPWMPHRKNRIYLGEFERCDEALEEALRLFDRVKGCFHCGTSCHEEMGSVMVEKR